jgi:hypothetical protein
MRGVRAGDRLMHRKENRPITSKVKISSFTTRIFFSLPRATSHGWMKPPETFFPTQQRDSNYRPEMRGCVAVAGATDVEDPDAVRPRYAPMDSAERSRACFCAACLARFCSVFSEGWGPEFARGPPHPVPVALLLLSSSFSFSLLVFFSAPWCTALVI